MAYSTFNASEQAGFSFQNRLAAPRAAFAGFFASLGRALTAASEGQARLDEAARLQAKSDAQLAELGIKRDDIVRHVFRDMLHV